MNEVRAIMVGPGLTCNPLYAANELSLQCMTCLLYHLVKVDYNRGTIVNGGTPDRRLNDQIYTYTQRPEFEHAGHQGA